MSVDADYISHIKKNGSNAGLEGMELTGERWCRMEKELAGQRESERVVCSEKEGKGES